MYDHANLIYQRNRVSSYFYFLFSSSDIVEDGLLTYITPGESVGVVTQYVPVALDGLSLPINISFPFGSQIRPTVYVSFLDIYRMVYML